MVKRHIKDSDDPSKPSPEVFKTIDFLVSAEDPNLFAFIVAQDAEQQKRTLSSDPAPEYKPVFGLLREEWIDESLKSWLERGADRRLRNTALLVLSELKSAPAWLRQWLQQEIKDAASERLAELAAPAICIHDPELLLSLWKEIIARKGSEREFLGWLQYRRVYDPKLATFTIHRWIEEGSPVRADSCLICYKLYLTSYVRTLNPKAEEFPEPVAAADWLNKAFPDSTAGPKPEK